MRKNKTAIERKQMILSYVEEYMGQHHFPPTMREICEGVGLRSVSTAHQYLAALENDGRICRMRGCSRAIQILSAS